MTINHNFPNLLYVGKAGQKKILQVGIVADLSATQSMRKKKKLATHVSIAVLLPK